MAGCSHEVIYEYCHDCGHVHVLQARLCRDRVCPICNWRLALRQYSQMLQTLNYYYEHYNAHTDAYFLTLTVPNCTPENVDYTMSKLTQDWDRLMHRSWCKKNIVGWARKTEITYNNRTNTLHPHLHVIVMATESPIPMIDYWLQYNPNANKQCQDLQSIDTGRHAKVDRQTVVPVDLSEPDESIVGAILETFKYTTKTAEILTMPLKTLRCYLQGIDGKRLIAYGGLIKDIRAELKLKEEETDIDEESTGMCIVCSSVQLERAAAAWSFATETYEQIKPTSMIDREITRVVAE